MAIRHATGLDTAGLNTAGLNTASCDIEDPEAEVTFVGEEPGTGSATNVVEAVNEAKRRVYAAMSLPPSLQQQEDLDAANEQLKVATSALTAAAGEVVKACSTCTAFIATKLLALLEGNVRAAIIIARLSEQLASNSNDDNRLSNAVAFCTALRDELSSGERADFGQSSVCEMKLLLQRVLRLLATQTKRSKEGKPCQNRVALHRTHNPHMIVKENFKKRAPTNGSWFGEGIYLSLFDTFTQFGPYCVVLLVFCGEADRLTHEINGNKPVIEPGYGNKSADPTYTEIVMPFETAEAQIVPLGFVPGYGRTATVFATVASTLARVNFPQDDHPDNTRLGFATHAHTFDPETALAWCVDDGSSSGSGATKGAASASASGGGGSSITLPSGRGATSASASASASSGGASSSANTSGSGVAPLGKQTKAQSQADRAALIKQNLKNKANASKKQAALQQDQAPATTKTKNKTKASSSSLTQEAGFQKRARSDDK